MGRKPSSPPNHYVLEQDAPRLEPNLGRWMDWMAAHEKDCKIEETKVTDEITVVTRFLGLEAFANLAGGPPKVFQSTVIGGKPHGMMQVHGEIAAARAGHPLLVKMVKKYFTEKNDENA
jgi:hypothetical protein